MWDPPGPGIKPMSPALAGRFFTTEPQRKPFNFYIQANSDTEGLDHLPEFQSHDMESDTNLDFCNSIIHAFLLRVL